MIVSEQFTIGTAEPTLVVPALHVAQEVQLHNHEHGNNHFVYVGGSSVTASTGFDVVAEGYVAVRVPAGEELWAISNHNGCEFHVLRIAK